MAYKTKIEKRAWRKGLFAGLRKKKKAAYIRKPKKKSKSYKKTYKKTMPPPGVYTMFGRVNENRVDDLNGPVVFWEGFEWDSHGRMKGEWIDGKFIPD